MPQLPTVSRCEADDGNRIRMPSLEGIGYGTAELRFCRSAVFGPALERLWIAAVYRSFGHVAATRQMLWRSVAGRAGHDDLAVADDRHVDGAEAVPGLSEEPGVCVIRLY
jgi:hypothetical protein